MKNPGPIPGIKDLKMIPRLLPLLPLVAVLQFPSLARAIDFDRDIRPILSDNCFHCHGPDAAERKADLRLDTQEGLFSTLEPGNPDASELIYRIFTDDDIDQMPPPESKLSLSDSEKQLVRDWIASGAEYEDHWAFAPVAPPTDAAAAISTLIDRHVREGLEGTGLKPSPPADPALLIRRLSFDLTGLPPEPATVRAFLADPSPAHYRRIVEDLLASTAHAEHLSLMWMDIARYSDSHGLHADGYREMWPWRDWVIRAFQENRPYDEFVTWQLAGDLLPNATREQRLATAFHRNHPMTGEGGVIDEEFRMHYVFDRVNTTGTAFLGLTLECARCHDHKFDPLSQQDYFQLAAYFNSVRELGMTGDDGNYGPLLDLPTPEQEARLSEIDRQIAALWRDFEPPSPGPAPTVDLPSGIHLPLDGLQDRTVTEKKDGKDVERTKKFVDGVLDAELRGGSKFTEGRSGKVLKVDREGHVILEGRGDQRAHEPFSLALWIKPDARRSTEREPGKRRVIASTRQSKNHHWRGWTFFLDSENHLNLRLTHIEPTEVIHVRSTQPVRDEAWSHVAFAYDGQMRAAGLRLFLDGAELETTTLANHLTRDIHPVADAAFFPEKKRPDLRFGRGGTKFTGDEGLLSGRMDDIHLFESGLTPLEVAVLASPDRTPAEVVANTPAALVEAHFRQRHPDTQAHFAQIRDLLRQRVEIASGVRHVMVMEEMAAPRQTHVLFRGEYSQPRQQVFPATPAVLSPSTPEGGTRLDFAHWLFADENPLTARVTANLYWQLVFGQGLVRTPHDFGIQGERPTHPELLDALAWKLQQSGWNVRALLRGMVLSETYRQDSRIKPEHRTIDPANRLLARAPAGRLPAESIRDAALAVSGLLVPKTGGPSVKPWQPEGLWREKSSFSKILLEYKPDEGEGRHRRTLYSLVRRTSPPPNMTAFDAPDRSVCSVKREVTNTPLQALVLLNDPQFVEAAKALTDRIESELPEASTTSRIEAMFFRIASREPRPAEREILLDLFNDQQNHANGLEPLAAVANTLLNYDAFYMER